MWQIVISVLGLVAAISCSIAFSNYKKLDEEEKQKK